MSVHTTPISVLGLGAMGAVLAAGALAAGRTITVWNRSLGRTDGLAASGARVANSAADAVGASPAAR